MKLEIQSLGGIQKFDGGPVEVDASGVLDAYTNQPIDEPSPPPIGIRLSAPNGLTVSTTTTGPISREGWCDIAVRFLVRVGDVTHLSELSFAAPHSDIRHHFNSEAGILAFCAAMSAPVIPIGTPLGTVIDEICGFLSPTFFAKATTRKVMARQVSSTKNLAGYRGPVFDLDTRVHDPQLMSSDVSVLLRYQLGVTGRNHIVY
jgi:hypothetical protein